MSRTPDVRFKGFTGDWKEQSLGDTFSMIQNNTLSRAELNDESGAAVNIHYGDVLINYGECLDVGKSKKQYIPSEKTALKYKSSWLKDGDVVMADTAEDETAGKCTEMFGIEGVSVVAGLHTIPLRPKMEFAGKYLGFYMNSPAFHDQLLPFMHGTKVTSVSKGEIKDTAIRFPEVRKEQEALGRYFHDLDTLIEQNQSEVDRLRNLKKALLLKLFPQKGSKVPEIRFKGFSEDWETKKISDVCFLSKESIDPRSFSEKYFFEYSMPAYDNGLAPDYVLGYSMNSTRIKVTSECILFNKLNVRKERIWYVENPKPMSVCSGEFLPLCSTDIYLPFLTQILKSKETTKAMESVSTGSSNSQKRIQPSSLMNYTVMIPKQKEEQRLIGQYFQALDSLIEQRQNNAERLKHLKQAMLQRMFV